MPAISTDRPRRSLRFARLTIPLLLALMCLWLIQFRLGGIPGRDIRLEMAGIPLPNWVGALLATGASFWALGRYDMVAHRHLRTGIAGRDARMAGMAAIAFSQTVGFGLVSGSFARWRVLGGLSAGQALRVTFFVSLTFLAVLGFLLGVVCLVMPPDSWMRWPGLGLAGLIGAGALASIRWPAPAFGRFRLTLPPLPALGALLGWVTVDTVAAALAFWLLFPAGAAPGLVDFYPVFLVALAAALISGAPGGIGPFELACLVMLDGIDATTLMGAILAFRMVYFAGPAVAGGLLILRPPRPELPSPDRAHDLPLPRNRPYAEAALALQPGGRVAGNGAATLAILDTPQTVTGLFGPLSGSPKAGLDLLQALARDKNRVACLYKCDARTALAARSAGWRVLRIAREAVLRPAEFSTDGPEKRQLRRKLRKAAQAGLDIGQATGRPPLPALRRIDAQWQARRGGARGLTMGRFDPATLESQRIWLARHEGRVCGFISAHATGGEWCLDLMRCDGTAPDGTMHALVRRMIADAAGAGVDRVSLAAIPDLPGGFPSAPGLARFKTCFDPALPPRYLTAPTWLALALAAADLACRVRWPRPVPPP